MDIIYGLIESMWRRWFGGAYSCIENKDSIWYKILESRGVQSVFNILFLWFLFYQCFNIADTVFGIFPKSWQSFIEQYKLYIALYNSCMFQFLFWSKGHGPIFDYGHGVNPSPETIQRYNEMWHTKYLDKFWEKCMIKYFPKYGYTYDLFSMSFRYSYPAVIVGLTAGFYIMSFGIIVAAIYALCWGIYDENPNWYASRHEIATGPTKVAEFIAGFCVGCLL